MGKYTERLHNGIIKENPTLVLMLGMCPTLAVTTSAFNGLGMGLSTTVVLILSNFLISLLRKIIPDKVRIPIFIVVVASFVTIVELLIEGFLPSLYDALGIYIPLIVVNCIILGRAESFAYKNKPLLSIFDGIGMGLGFTLALTVLGALREIIGAGSVFGFHILPSSYEPVSIFVMAPGAFFVLAVLQAIQNKLRLPSATNKWEEAAEEPIACGGNCTSCSGYVCKENRIKLATVKVEEKAAKANKTANPAAVSQMSVVAEKVNRTASEAQNTGKEE